MQTVITHNVLPYDERCEKNYTQNRENFETYLVEELEYSRRIASETNDWRENYQKAEYAVYVTTQPTIKELQKQAFIKFSKEYPDEARDLILNQAQ